MRRRWVCLRNRRRRRNAACRPPRPVCRGRPTPQAHPPMSRGYRHIISQYSRIFPGVAHRVDVLAHEERASVPYSGPPPPAKAFFSPAFLTVQRGIHDADHIDLGRVISPLVVYEPVSSTRVPRGSSPCGCFRSLIRCPSTRIGSTDGSGPGTPCARPDPRMPSPRQGRSSARNCLYYLHGSPDPLRPRHNTAISVHRSRKRVGRIVGCAHAVEVAAFHHRHVFFQHFQRHAVAQLECVSWWLAHQLDRHAVHQQLRAPDLHDAEPHVHPVEGDRAVPPVYQRNDERIERGRLRGPLFGDFTAKLCSNIVSPSSGRSMRSVSSPRDSTRYQLRRTPAARPSPWLRMLPCTRSVASLYSASKPCAQTSRSRSGSSLVRYTSRNMPDSRHMS